MASRIVTLHLALHHHQPFGNLPGVLEDCCRHGYLPLLRLLEEASPLKFNLSYSGPLLLYLAENFPEYLEILQRMAGEGRVEILATGFYEPILADLEDDDRLGQLALTRDWWSARGLRPAGLWLAEGVWATDLPRTLAQAGLAYTVVTRDRLLQAGVPGGALHGHLVTEHMGDCCRLFPNDDTLLRMIPFAPADELFAFLRRMANRGDIALTCADQAERWSVWPGSRERLLDSGHLRQLLARFCEQADWIRLGFFSETLAANPPTGHCYLPPGVSKELGVWSLPDETRLAFQQARQNLQARFDADQFLPYFRAGSWAGFRARYLESNLMHKKGLWLKRRLPSDHPHRAEIQRHLHEAQCNTAYWYGTSGGIYSPHLREAVWRSLLSAQSLALQGQPAQIVVADSDADGSPEVLLESPTTALAWSSARGGALFEWSHLGTGFNLCNTMTRYRESGPGPAPEGGAAAVVDPWTRHAFQEIFFRKQTTVEELATGRATELGDFIGQPFECLQEKTADGGHLVVFLRRGSVKMTAPVPVKMQKSFLWHPERPDELRIAYRLENQGKLSVQAVLGVQVNLALPGGDEHMQWVVGEQVYAAGHSWYEGAATVWRARSVPGTPSFHFQADRPLLLWSYPVVCNSAEGTTPIRQGSAVVSGIPLHLAPGEADTVTFCARWSVV
ncbi:MAG: alpha-amylase/4-alpha-glucanotransferase domain-containing protein [Candidatus Methylacidiphilales bacterium]|nr:alpha-amylase/4-alpha-glucanotransferase domain-containing protein [Candidatus Methylacidiphilales bacterium]